MGALDSRFERVADIERRLMQRPEGYTTGELAREYGKDPATIYRDFMMLRSMGTVVDRKGRRWVLDHRRALHSVRLTTHEVMALYLAARLLSRHSDEHNPHVVKALDKLADAVRLRSPLVAQHIGDASDAVRQRPQRLEYVEAMEVLTIAWAQGRKVRIRYRSYSRGEETQRVFAPYFIEPSSIGYACHVIGFDELRGAIRTLKIERIREAELMEEEFSVPADFDPGRLLATAWGVIWQDDGQTEVTLRFAASVVRRLKESTWHASQRIEDLPDGGCLFTVRVGSTMEFKPWVRQWGAAVEVLAPTQFRAEIAAEVRQMATTYGAVAPE